MNFLIKKQKLSTIQQIESVERFKKSINTGLSDEEVNIRKEQKLTNKTKKASTKSYPRILLDNVFTFFNILLFVIAALLIYTANYSSLFFLVILFCNMAIGLFQDIKARRLVDKLKIVISPNIEVMRNGIKTTINVDDIVLDDIIILSSGLQIPCDCKIIEGRVTVDESLLTGESKALEKKVEDLLYAGSYIRSGDCYARVERVKDANYATDLERKSHEFRRPKSEILKSLQTLFRIIAIIVLSLGLSMIVTNYFRGEYKDFTAFKESVGTTAGSLVAMIPSGMYLLTSLTLAVGVIRLAKKRTLVQELYGIEMLARIDTLCIDKTGTLTDGKMEVKDVITSKEYKDGLEILASYVHLDEHPNFTGIALKEHFKKYEKITSYKYTSFSSEFKTSFAIIDKKTYVLGAPEFIQTKDSETIKRYVDEETSKGYRVLLFAKSDKIIDKHENIKDEVFTPLAIIVLVDHIKDDAKATLEWYASNGVNVRIISGDNVNTAREVAKRVGLKNAEKAISLENMSIDDVKKIANDYVVFARVSPEQKEAIIKALREEKHVVAMVGDGVNDILALKSSDCSIAMANGADAAKKASHFVMLDSNFSSLPSVVEQGRQVINNLQSTNSLFLVKTFFAMFITFIFTVASLATISLDGVDITFPFKTNNFYVWEFLTIGIASFFLALQTNTHPISGAFTKNTLRNAFPGAIAIASGVIVIYLFNLLDAFNVVSSGLSANESIALTMSTMYMTFISAVYLFRRCIPFNLYRIVLFVSICIVATLAVFTISWMNWDLLNTSFIDFDWRSYLILLFIALSGAVFYVILDLLFHNIKIRRSKRTKQYEN